MIKLETSHGDITIELDEDKTPETCKNFVNYAQEGYYDGTIFHRVISGFMIQGGGFTAGMEQKETNEPIENEADKGDSNKRGTIAMARTSDPHSASAQFFINLEDNTFLDHKDKSMQGWGYCVFGRVTEGMDVVDKIAKVQTGAHSGHQDVPTEEIVIKRVVVE